MRFSLILLLLCGFVFAQDYRNYEDMAESLWNMVKDKFGTKGGIENNADVPLKTGAPMTNVSGTKQFSVRIQCPSAKEGVKVTFLPLAGNDYRLVIQQDLNMDGNYEYVYDTGTAGVRVSGVCLSGIVSCSGGGSWDGCEYYYWEGGSSGYVSLVRTQDTSLLGGCFCTNRSCGVNSLIQEIADYIAGGISQAIMKVKKELTVSKSDFNTASMSLSLYLQDRERCSYGGNKIYGETNPTEFYETQTPPDGNDYIATRPDIQNDPQSPYYIVNQVSDIEINNQSFKVPERISCDIRKDVSVYTVDMYENCNKTWTDSNGEVWCEVYFKSLHEDQWADLFSCVRIDAEAFTKFRNCVLQNGFNVCGATYEYTCASEGLCKDTCRIGPGESRYGIEYVRASVTLSKPFQKYAVRLKPRNTSDVWECKFFLFKNTTTGEELIYRQKCDKNWDRREVVYKSPPFKDGGTFVIEGEYAVDDWGRGWSGYDFYVYKSQIYKEDQVSLAETNTCPAESECIIKNEWICDNTGEVCIQTINEGVRTGINPSPVCYTTGTSIGNYMVCAYGDRIEVRGNPSDYDKVFNGSNMWFWIKREYECPPRGFNIDLSRPMEVISSTSYSEDTGEISYQDFECQNGTCTPADGFTIQAGKPDACPVATCIVGFTSRDTSVFADGTNRSQTQGGTDTATYEVRICDEDDAGNKICPAGRGEAIIEDCRCEQGLDSVGFSVAITTLEAVVEASKDLICSTVSQ